MRRVYPSGKEKNSDTRVLNAGYIHMTLNQGEIKDIFVKDQKIIVGIYFAVRDCNWGTVPCEISHLDIREDEDKFLVRFKGVHNKGQICFEWEGRIYGSSENEFTFEFSGEALCRFEKNRIGFCVLFPGTFSGRPCRVYHSEQLMEDSFFPHWIEPDQPFKDIKKIEYKTDKNDTVTVSFQGETFEMEDQRNWTDDSYKVYGTPLDRPFPVTVHGGDRFGQRITVKVTASKSEYQRIKSPDQKLNFENRLLQLPELGICYNEKMLKPARVLIQKLNLSHIRYDLFFNHCERDLIEELGQIKDMGKKVFLAVHFTKNYTKEMDYLKGVLKHTAIDITAALILQEDKIVPDARMVEDIYPQLKAMELKTGTGTDAFYTQINRRPPNIEYMDFISYSNNPQVHAFDNASILSTVRGQASNVESCIHKFGGKPVYVTPVTLKMRWNPDQTCKEDNAFQKSIDPRQKTLFNAVWTLSSIVSLTKAGAASIDYFEIFGLRGIMEINGAGQEQCCVFPVYWTFYWLLEKAWDGCRILENSSCTAVLMTHENDKRILIGNKRPGEQKLYLETEEVLAFQALEEKMGAAKIESDGGIVMPAYSLVCIDFR